MEQLVNLTNLAPRMNEVICTSRNLAEYRAMFGISDAEFLRGPVLDCPGGASSFNVEMRKIGGRVVSVDPIYGNFSPSEFMKLLAQQRKAHLNRSYDHPGLYDHSWAGSVGRRAEMWSAAAEEFLADYAKYTSDSPDGPYIAGSLPKLPFPDRSFALVLSGHLLFSYPEHFSFDDHFNFITELVRVVRDDGEVRIHPLVDSIGTDYPQLVKLRKKLDEHGIRTQIVNVDYQMHQGGNRTLICKRADTSNRDGRSRTETDRQESV